MVVGIRVSTTPCKLSRLNTTKRPLTVRVDSVEDSSIRYVAEENIEIVKPHAPTSLMGLAGRYFKRWDPLEHQFVSNVRDEYPHD